MCAVEASTREPRFNVDDFEAWLPDTLEPRVALRSERSQFYALAEDFDITGTGATPAAAVKEMIELVSVYLASFYFDGQDFADALRPIPWWLKVEIRVQSAISRLVLETLPLARERRYVISRPLLDGAARC